VFRPSFDESVVVVFIAIDHVGQNNEVTRRMPSPKLNELYETFVVERALASPCAECSVI
jgi:hypothetical protein